MFKFKRLISLIAALLCVINIYSQKEANIWYFGNAGLDFNSGVPVALTDGQLNTSEGCASIADIDGNLLFYTDGITVYNRNHSIMTNGNNLNGHPSSTNSAIIVPKPDYPNIYYIFTVDAEGNSNGLQYSEIDMTLDSGLGGVTSNKNIILESPVTEKVTAVKNIDGKSIWVVGHKWHTNEFIAYKVSNTGVDGNPVISQIGSVITDNVGNSTGGAIKISPDGKKLAVANNIVLDNVELFDFNSATGIVSNYINLVSFESSTSPTGPYGIEFSPNSNLLYVSVLEDGIYQYNIYSGGEKDINNSRIKIFSSSDVFGAMQLATDGKIYVSNYWKTFLDVINFPNNLGVSCDFQKSAVSLNGRKAFYGLPQFIQSYFSINTFDTENTCFSDTTTFELQDTVDSAIWDFGDPASSVNNTSSDLEPTHVFSAPGTYEVSVTATVGTETATKTTSVIIYEQPQATKPYDILLCDYKGDISFDLQGHSIYILDGLDPNVFGVNYYEGMTNYTNGIKIDVPDAYTNSLSFFTQEIIAEVYNKQNQECTDITEFNIGIHELPMLKSTDVIPGLELCDDIDSGSDTDGMSVFDLTKQEGNLLVNPVASGVLYNYYKDAALTQPIASPSSFVNTENPQTIYVEGVNNANSECRMSTSFTIQVHSLPQITTPVTLKQCDDDLDGFSYFNLDEALSKITSNSASETIAFFESQANAENNINPINNPKSYRNLTVSTDVIWARVDNSNGCYRVGQVNLVVTTTQIPNTFNREFYVCDDDTDGISSFNFSNVQTEIEAMFPSGQDLDINYYRNEADALAEDNNIDDISSYKNTGYPNTQQIYIRVDSKLDNDCLGLGAHISLYVEPQPIANPVTIARLCDDDQDGIFAFDTSKTETTVLNGQSLSNVTVAYFDENNNPLPSPLPNPFLTSSQIITIRVTNNNVIDGSCFDETTLEFIVDKQPIANAVPNQISCDDGIDDADGLHDFDTSFIENAVLNGQTDMDVHYYNSSGIELPSPLPNPFVSDTQTITVEVVNPSNLSCTATTDIEFIVNSLPEFTIKTPQIVCSSDPTFTVVLDPFENDANEIYDYEWVYDDGTILSNTPTLTVSTPGTYSITLTKTDGTGCSRTRDVFVNASELATITLDDITIIDVSNNNTVTVNTNNLGQGDYEFALDDEFSFYQDESMFEHVSSGIHTLYIRDKKGCGTSSIDISVIGFPKFFTPNGDGNNDTWQIAGVNGKFQTGSDIYIYDRYGKLLKQLNPKSTGWDGTFNGNMLPTDDYWFSVSLEDGRVFKGHFTLKR